MKISNYEELNKLVAQSLGWESSITFIDVDKGDYKESHEFEFYHPPGLNEDEAEDWFSEWLCICPQFSTDTDYCENFILAECDRLDFFIEWHRSPQNITCVIRQPGSLNMGASQVGMDTNYPRSFPLATCLAWLAFKEIEFELDLSGVDNEQI